MNLRLLIVVGVGSLALQGACTTPVDRTAQPASFLLEPWKLQYVIGCSGEHETKSADGSVVHELYVCAGSYSDAQCTTARAIQGELIIARCTYSVTAGHTVHRYVRYLSCDVPSDDMKTCGSDNVLWDDAGARPPKF
jgi:hypothetical protein